ncbi:MAG: sulfotransferase, partial [Planctomycetota bacterium]
WEQERSPVVGATCHRHFDELLRLWPEARFVHIVRDPRDVARSRMKLGWSGHIWQAADPWLDAELLWEQFAPKLADDRKHELIFERLVSEPEAELTRLAAFLGVDYDPAMLSYPDDTTYEAVNAKLAGQWKGKMSDRDLQLIDQKLGSWLDRYGYERHEPGRDASTGPSKLKLLQFRVKNKVGVVGNEIKKYGWRPMLAKGVGRRLRIAPLHRWAHEQINARHRELIQ